MIGRPSQAWLHPNQLCSRVAIHFRHLQIHEHDVERRRPVAFRQDTHCFATMIGDSYDSARALQKLSGNLLVHFVVFDQKNSNAVCGLRMRSICQQTARGLLSLRRFRTGLAIVS